MRPHTGETEGAGETGNQPQMGWKERNTRQLTHAFNVSRDSRHRTHANFQRCRSYVWLNTCVLNLTHHHFPRGRLFLVTPRYWEQPNTYLATTRSWSCIHMFYVCDLNRKQNRLSPKGDRNSCMYALEEMSTVSKWCRYAADLDFAGHKSAWEDAVWCPKVSFIARA